MQILQDMHSYNHKKKTQPFISGTFVPQPKPLYLYSLVLQMFAPKTWAKAFPLCLGKLIIWDQRKNHLFGEDQGWCQLFKREAGGQLRDLIPGKSSPAQRVNSIMFFILPLGVSGGWGWNKIPDLGDCSCGLCIWHAYVYPSSIEKVFFSFNTLNCSSPLFNVIRDLSGIHLRQGCPQEWVLTDPFFLRALSTGLHTALIATSLTVPSKFFSVFAVPCIP